MSELSEDEVREKMQRLLDSLGIDREDAQEAFEGLREHVEPKRAWVETVERWSQNRPVEERRGFYAGMLFVFIMHKYLEGFELRGLD